MLYKKEYVCSRNYKDLFAARCVRRVAAGIAAVVTSITASAVTAAAASVAEAAAAAISAARTSPEVWSFIQALGATAVSQIFCSSNDR